MPVARDFCIGSGPRRFFSAASGGLAMTAAAPVSAPVDGVELRAVAAAPRAAEILTPAALAFLADLHRRFDARRRALLARRAERQKRFDAGELPDFLPETSAIRDGDWKVAPIPADLLDRRVEITGPVDRKMIINALNSGAKVFMADFEDATSPAFANMIEGQVNLLDRWRGAHRLHRRRQRQALRGEAQSRRADGAPARLASRRAPSAGRRRGHVGLAVRLRALRLPLRQAADRQGLDARLLPAQAGEPSRGAAVERRVRRTPRPRSASRTEPSRRRC